MRRWRSRAIRSTPRASAPRFAPSPAPSDSSALSTSPATGVSTIVIRRRLGYAPGDLFRRAAIEQTQQRLGALGLFKSVEIRAEDIDARPAAVPTLITVEE